MFHIINTQQLANHRNFVIKGSLRPDFHSSRRQNKLGPQGVQEIPTPLTEMNME